MMVNRTTNLVALPTSRATIPAQTLPRYPATAPRDLIDHPSEGRARAVGTYPTPIDAYPAAPRYASITDRCQVSRVWVGIDHPSMPGRRTNCRRSRRSIQGRCTICRRSHRSMRGRSVFFRVDILPSPKGQGIPFGAQCPARRGGYSLPR